MVEDVIMLSIQEIEEFYPKSYKELIKWFIENTTLDSIYELDIRDFIMFFDYHSFYICIDCEPTGKKWYATICGIDIDEATNRYDAEVLAITDAFETLESTL